MGFIGGRRGAPPMTTCTSLGKKWAWVADNINDGTRDAEYTFEWTEGCSLELGSEATLVKDALSVSVTQTQTASMKKTIKVIIPPGKKVTLYQQTHEFKLENDFDAAKVVAGSAGGSAAAGAGLGMLIG